MTILQSPRSSGQEKGPKFPELRPELRMLDVFIGAFECEGQAFPTPMSEPHPIERTIVGKMDLDGFWLFMRFEDKETAANPRPIRGIWQLTYDAANKTFLALWTDNLGRWFPQTSTGWEGDTITFTGAFTLNGQKGAVRDIFTRRSERDMLMRVELQRDGGWMPFLELNCRRS